MKILNKFLSAYEHKFMSKGHPTFTVLKDKVVK